jgi:hypothetical protein
MSTDTIRRYIVMGSRRVSNYWWATVRWFRGLGFIIRIIKLFTI